MELKEHKDSNVIQNLYNYIKDKMKRALARCKKHRHTITLIALTFYVTLNWKSCISMQFFSEFNGNNILFLVWILLILLTLYDVEAKDIKIKKREMKEEYENAKSQYRLETISKSINDISKGVLEGDVKHGPSDKNDDC